MCLYIYMCRYMFLFITLSAGFYVVNNFDLQLLAVLLIAPPVILNLTGLSIKGIQTSLKTSTLRFYQVALCIFL